MLGSLSYLKTLLVALSLALLVFHTEAHAVSPDDHPRLRAIYDELVERQIYEADELRALLAKAEFQQSVVDAMTSPAEYKFTWGKYRKIFMQEERYQQGVDFWLEHEQTFTRAEQEYGVPASMIAAILGVESKFGRFKGKHKVLDSLVTLIIGYERRSAFFASELREFLLLTKENNLNAAEVLGSYAGAVGFPQFISSSYRNYAVDFNGDGVTDLINQPEDAIGSIANYFVENGWRPGKSITSSGHADVPVAVAELASRKREVKHRAGELRRMGAPLDSSIPDDERLGVLMLNASEIVPDESARHEYIVRAGDTACEIAEAHNVSCKELFKLNRLNNRGDIFRGQKLKLPKQALQPVKVSKDSNWKVSSAAVVANAQDLNQGATEIPRYFFTHHNFYVITRYNQSVLYAMAVRELSDAIAAARADRMSATTGE